MTTHTHTNAGQASLNLSTARNQQAAKPAKRLRFSSYRGGQGIVPIPRVHRKRITKFFASITPYTKARYINQWRDLRPRSDHEELNRFRFAYCTVHTSWLNSCIQYDAIRNLYDNVPLNTLSDILKDTPGGMYNIKAVGIDKLHELWDSNIFVKQNGVQWQRFRNVITDNLPKLGLAKTSFALEMIYPLTAQVICIDRHMWKAFGWLDPDKSGSPAQYHYYENYWLMLSKAYDVPPVIARNIYWDQIQNQPNSLYWAKYL